MKNRNELTNRQHIEVKNFILGMDFLVKVGAPTCRHITTRLITCATPKEEWVDEKKHENLRRCELGKAVNLLNGLIDSSSYDSDEIEAVLTYAIGMIELESMRLDYKKLKSETGFDYILKSFYKQHPEKKKAVNDKEPKVRKHVPKKAVDEEVRDDIGA